MANANSDLLLASQKWKIIQMRAAVEPNLPVHMCVWINNYSWKKGNYETK